MKAISIDSENAEYQVIRALKESRAKRAKAGEVFIEGTESIKQAAAASLEATRAIFDSGRELSGWARGFLAERPLARRIAMAPRLYRALCDREEPSELLVTARAGLGPLAGLSLPDEPFVLVLDRPGDCGNFGSIVRSANSFGVDAVLVLGHAVDAFDPKAIRSSLGAVFRTRLARVESMRELESWLAGQRERSGLILVGTDSSGESSLPDRPLRRPVALALGNEAKGLSVALKGLCDLIVRIPIEGAVNSLNVACAGSIFMWDVYRNGGRRPK